MGYISSNAEMKKELCANEGSGGKHPRPCSADHIGPISLGFCHRPEFQLLCKPCNSAKNNRMYYSDVMHLIDVEGNGETVVSWYANSIWQKCKSKVIDKETALQLSRVMRDNRNVAMLLLAEFMDRQEYLFLFALLNLDYAEYEYDIIPGTERIIDQIVTVGFSRKASTLRYVNIQKTRKTRIAYSALAEYAKKENRNGFTYTNPAIEALKVKAFRILSKVDTDLKKMNATLISALDTNNGSDVALEKFINAVNYKQLLQNDEYLRVKEILSEIMEIVAIEIASNWDDPRYSRDYSEG